VLKIKGEMGRVSGREWSEERWRDKEKIIGMKSKRGEEGECKEFRKRN
jgi:hypothetical protein